MLGHLQDLSSLPSISAVVDDKGRDLDEEFKVEAKAILQNFLQVHDKYIFS